MWRGRGPKDDAQRYAASNHCAQQKRYNRGYQLEQNSAPHNGRDLFDYTTQISSRQFTPFECVKQY